MKRPLQEAFVILLLGGITSCLSSDDRLAQTAHSGQGESSGASVAESPRPSRPAAEPASACAVSRIGPAAELQLARCLAGPSLRRRASGSPAPVALYLDRSGSMRGFLDPEYPTRIRTDFRSVLDAIVVGLHPVRAFSYGARVRAIDPSLGVVGRKAFYSDMDTRLEDVTALVQRDTAATTTHVIIGDGRRGSPDVANGQFVSMRRVADQWIARGGTVLVATSLAPFKTVASDPSGCRQGSDAAGPQTCPLYAFVYAAPGDEVRIAAALADVFEHVFAWPVPVIPADALLLSAPSRSRRDLTLERRWAAAPDGTPIARVRGPAATNQPLSAAIALADSTTPTSRAYGALLASQEIGYRFAARPLATASARRDWIPAGGGGALVSASRTLPLGLDFVTRGDRAPRSIVRIDLVPSGLPRWLDRFDAADSHDVVRTYGLGRLFESFRQTASQDPAPLGRLYVVIN